jgi:hypothetical protein
MSSIAVASLTGFPLLLTLAQAPHRAQDVTPPHPSVNLSVSIPSASLPAPGEKPYLKLFLMAGQAATVETRVRHADGQKPPAKIVCGMVVILADPKVDPDFVRTAPVDTSGMKIRRIAPDACAE